MTRHWVDGKEVECADLYIYLGPAREMRRPIPARRRVGRWVHFDTIYREPPETVRVAFHRQASYFELEDPEKGYRNELWEVVTYTHRGDGNYTEPEPEEATV